jgi:hypothetical protein
MAAVKEDGGAAAAHAAAAAAPALPPPPVGKSLRNVLLHSAMEFMAVVFKSEKTSRKLHDGSFVYDFGIAGNQSIFESVVRGVAAAAENPADKGGALFGMFNT